MCIQSWVNPFPENKTIDRVTPPRPIGLIGSLKSMNYCSGRFAVKSYYEVYSLLEIDRIGRLYCVAQVKG